MSLGLVGMAAAAVRWEVDEDGHEVPAGLFCPWLVPVEDEDAQAGGQGNGGTTHHTQVFVWQVKWQKRKTEANAAQAAMPTHRRWAAWLESVTIGEDQLREGGDGTPGQAFGDLVEVGNREPLVVEIEKVGAALDEPTKGMPGFVTFFEFVVNYDTNRGDPYVGPGISLLEE